MFSNFLAVGAGGAIGAMGRYAVGLIPALQRGGVPPAHAAHQPGRCHPHRHGRRQRPALDGPLPHPPAVLAGRHLRGLYDVFHVLAGVSDPAGTWADGAVCPLRPPQRGPVFGWRVAGERHGVRLRRMIGWVVLGRTWFCWYTTDSVRKVALIRPWLTPGPPSPSGKALPTQCKLGTMFLLSTTQKAFPEGEGGREADE